MINKFLFYFLSFTWGLPMTLIGLVVGGFLLLMGKRPDKWGSCWHFTLGKYWGGISLGLIFITDDQPTDSIKNHEHGHAIQNCYFGPFTPFVINIPSAIRYWYRRFRDRIGRPCKTGYYDIWFEEDASLLGGLYINKWII